MKIESILSREKEHPSHAYIFLGRDEVLDQATNIFIKQLNVFPADCYLIDGEESIKIEVVRKLLHWIGIKPHSSKNKLVIIKKAYNLTSDASNALLKTLEEPPLDTIIVLTARDEKQFLPTIISRCRKIEFRNNEKVVASLEAEKTLDNIKVMSVKEKFDLANQLSKDADLEELFDNWLLIFREEMLEKNINKDIIKKILFAKRILRQNVNKRLLLENILLEI